MELVGSLCFIQKFEGKLRTHLLEICFNSRRKFIRIVEFVTNKKTTSLIVPKGVKGRGWEALWKTISLMLESLFFLSLE